MSKDSLDCTTTMYSTFGSVKDILANCDYEWQEFQ